MEKARTLPCDCVILDLEDSVAPEDKEAARARAVEVALTGGFGERELVVRINALDTPWGDADLTALIRAFGDIDGVLVPKVTDHVLAGRLAMRMGPMPDRVRLWLMIETCRALFHLEAIAGLRRVSALVLGLNDLGLEMGAVPGADRAPFHAAMSMTVAAARAHGVAAIDAVFNGIEDEVGLAREARQGRAFGFDGKTLIHPNQIETCNRIFSPSPEELAWAQAVEAAFAAAPEQGVIRVQGRMVERLHLEQARRTLAAAGRST